MEKKFVLCINDGGYPESLEKRKFYEVVADSDADQQGLVRVVDESGEDYLYSKSMFLEINLPSSVNDALKAA